MNSSRIDVLEAVQSAINISASISTLFPGGIWTGEIPEDLATNFPSAVVDISNSQYEWTSQGSCLEKTNLSVSIFASSVSTLVDIADVLQEYLTDYDYSFSFQNNDYLVYMFPLERTTRSEIIRHVGGDQIFAADLIFEAAIFRN